MRKGLEITLTNLMLYFKTIIQFIGNCNSAIIIVKWNWLEDLLLQDATVLNRDGLVKYCTFSQFCNLTYRDLPIWLFIVWSKVAEHLLKIIRKE